MAPPGELAELVERFDRNLEAYRSPAYNEAQLRKEFLDPFFEALGWDVNNRQGSAEPYKDVIHEFSLKLADATKAPDYCFRIGGQPKFYVEAKKPAINIKEDPSPAYQLRRYAWSSKLPLSILTDFEELAVYDTRITPAPAEKPSAARTRLLRYTEYADHWDFLASTFSPEAIRKGSFDKYVESSRLKRGTAEVDSAFLREIESWRSELARNLALRNHLSQRELNFAVQRTIDRIIFLRICEDRGIEPYQQLKNLAVAPPLSLPVSERQGGSGIYPQLCALFQKADERYNSGLFHFQKEPGRAEELDSLTLAVKIDDKVLRDIFRRLYYPDSPYEFSVLPADILGQVYEQFLGKVIRLTEGGHAKVEDKPEVKKAGGVYYTPTYIVDYIVKHTVGKLLEGKTPKQAAKLRILDPACGSGSFLLGAYQYLLAWHRDWLEKDGPEKHKKELCRGPRGEWRLTTSEKKKILLNNLYGVDIDSQAVEVTKLSLLLKVLGGESEQTLSAQLKLFHERALPDLGSNIKCGNSLIGPDFYEHQQMELLSEEECYRINVFDWKKEFKGTMDAGGFDAVIGNPPYDVMEKERGKASWPHSALVEYVRCQPAYKAALGGKLNLFRFFVICGRELTRARGRFGMIVPLALLGDISCAQSRTSFLSQALDVVADCFPQKDNPRRRVFVNAKLSTVVLTCAARTRGDESPIRVNVYPGNSFAEESRTCTVTLTDARLLDPENTPIPQCDQTSWELCKKLHRIPRAKRLAEVNDIVVTRGEINQTIFRAYIVGDSRKRRLLKGAEVGRYCLHERLSQGEREWFDERRFLRENAPRPIVNVRRIATQRITGVDERLRIVATIVDPPCYFADSTNSLHLREGSLYTLEYVLALLNSKLFQWRFKITSTNNNVGTNELNCLPFYTLRFDNPTDRLQHDRLAQCVGQMLSLRDGVLRARTGQERTVAARKIGSFDSRIDHIVYQLYDLTPEEIALVEATTQPAPRARAASAE